MDNNIWKLGIVLLWITIIAVTLGINEWEANAKPGFSLLTFWLGIFLGILLGIISIKLNHS